MRTDKIGMRKSVTKTDWSFINHFISVKDNLLLSVELSQDLQMFDQSSCAEHFYAGK